MSEVAYGRTSTVEAGTTVPVASSVMGTSRLTAGTLATLTGGPEAAAPGPEAAAGAAGAAPLAAADAPPAALVSDLPPQPAARPAHRAANKQSTGNAGLRRHEEGSRIEFTVARA